MRTRIYWIYAYRTRIRLELSNDLAIWLETSEYILYFSTHFPSLSINIKYPFYWFNCIIYVITVSIIWEPLSIQQYTHIVFVNRLFFTQDKKVVYSLAIEPSYLVPNWTLNALNRSISTFLCWLNLVTTRHVNVPIYRHAG